MSLQRLRRFPEERNEITQHVYETVENQATPDAKMKDGGTKEDRIFLLAHAQLSTLKYIFHITFNFLFYSSINRDLDLPL